MSTGSSTTSASDIKLEADFFVHFGKKLEIDLGGIAKGHAIDRAALTLENRGVNAYVINAGGDVRVGKSAQNLHPQSTKSNQDNLRCRDL